MLTISILINCFFTFVSSRRVHHIKFSLPNELERTLMQVQSGSEIVVQDGTYTTIPDFLIDKNTNNVLIRSQTPGGVKFIGSVYFSIKGNGNTISGFQFLNGSSANNAVIDVFGKNNSITELNFKGYSAKKYVNIQANAQYNLITKCNFQAKPASAPLGNTVGVLASSVIGYNKISYCSFQDGLGNGGDNGNEPIRLGLSTMSLFNSRTIVEHCYFSNTGLADSETISVKSRENIIRYNTFTNQQNGMLSFRNGDYNIAYSNFFLGAAGIRVKQSSNIYIYNNYFERSGDAKRFPLQFDNVSEFPNYTQLYEHNIHVQYNTFKDCGIIDLGPLLNKVGAVWANNIIQQNVYISVPMFQGIATGISWLKSIYYGSASLGVTIPTSSILSSSPSLQLNSQGYFTPSSTGSAAVGAAVSSPVMYNIPNLNDDPSVLLDISGNTRPSSRSIGCSEPLNSNSQTSNKPLTLADVGPSYLRPTAVPTVVPSFRPSTSPSKKPM